MEILKRAAGSDESVASMVFVASVAVHRFPRTDATESTDATDATDSTDSTDATDATEDGQWKNRIRLDRFDGFDQISTNVTDFESIHGGTDTPHPRSTSPVSRTTTNSD